MALTDEDKVWIANTMVELLRPTNARLDAIDARLERMDARLDAIDTRLDAIDLRLDGIDARWDRMDARFDKIDTRFDRVDDYILKFPSEVLSRFDIIDQRLDFLASSFNKLDMQVPPLNRAVVDFGILAGQFAREQMFTREHDADIATRIARLEDQVSKLIKPAA